LYDLCVSCKIAWQERVAALKVADHHPNVFSLLQTGDDEHPTVYGHHPKVYGHHGREDFSLEMVNDQLQVEGPIW